MDSVDKQKLKKLMHELSLKYNLSANEIKEIVESPYEFAASKLKTINWDEIDNEEKLGELKTNFNFKSLGKLHAHWPLLNRKLQSKKRRNESSK
jgi:hypothetical protein